MPQSENSSLIRAAEIAAFFDIPRPVTAHDFEDKGNMSHEMYLIRAGMGAETREYLLQRMNNDVFTNPVEVVRSLESCMAAQRAYMEANPLPEGVSWHTVRLVRAAHGRTILEIVDEASIAFWRLMERIPGCVAYKSLSMVQDNDKRLQLAEQAARGLALFGDLTSNMEAEKLSYPLPGYRDTRVYYAQLDSVMGGTRTLDDAGPYLPTDETVKEGTQFHFWLHLDDEEYEARLNDPELQPYIDTALENRDLALTLLRAIERGTVRLVAIHGDTKLENFLFDAETGAVRALVDLDTIMPHTWLADWGDMARSLVNVAGEKVSDLGEIRVDLDIFEALARGYLSTAREATDAEIALMVEAVQILALELGVRFLADYLRGDTYFKLAPEDPPDLNKTRAMVQLTLFQELAANAQDMRTIIERYAMARRHP